MAPARSTVAHQRTPRPRPGVRRGRGRCIFARLAFEILGPIPVGELFVEAKIVWPGRRISLREATFSEGAGRPVML